MSKFRLSQRSLSRMEGVHPDLVRVVKRAIELTEIDFGITEGLRTKERQRELVAAGASKTMNSRHLTGHAIDVAAYVGGEVRWDWPLYITIAEAFQQAARELDVPIIWGGCWGRLDLVMDIDQSIADYTARKRREGGRPLLDGPHYELDKQVYA